MRPRLLALPLLVLAAGVPLRAQNVQWEPTPGGPPAPTYGLLAFGDTLLAVADGPPRLFRSTDRGGTWALVPAVGLPSWFWFETLMRTRAGVLLVGLDSLYRSEDGGATWSGSALPLVHPTAEPTPERVTALFETAGGALFVGTYWSGLGQYGHIYRSDDAVTWSLAVEEDYRASVRAFAEAPGGALIAARSSGFEGGAAGLFRSADGGATWDLHSTGAFGDVAALPDGRLLALNPSFPGTAVWRSDDAGATWTSIATLDPGQTSLYVAGPLVLALSFGSRGLNVSTDGGESWVPAQAGLEDLSMYDVVHDAQGYLYAATSGGVYRTTTAVVSTEPLPPPAGVALEAVGPNPAAGPATVAFTLDVPADVHLALYDALGRRAVILAAGARGVGRHVTVFDTGGLAPGVYTVVLRVGRHVAHTRLVHR
jgi:photosystem II stability/assembly factor-like uncharacterized protein